MSYLITRSGKFFSLDSPHPSQIDLEDIVYSLSRTPRWRGMTPQPYSVLQHSLLAWDILQQDELSQPHSAELQKAVLMHDAHEAYVGDIPTPLKRKLRDRVSSPLKTSPLDTLISKTDQAIEQALDVKLFDHAPEINDVDAAAFAVEANHFFPNTIHMFQNKPIAPSNGRWPKLDPILPRLGLTPTWELITEFMDVWEDLCE